MCGSGLSRDFPGPQLAGPFDSQGIPFRFYCFSFIFRSARGDGTRERGKGTTVWGPGIAAGRAGFRRTAVRAGPVSARRGPDDGASADLGGRVLGAGASAVSSRSSSRPLPLGGPPVPGYQCAAPARGTPGDSGRLFCR